MDIRDHFRVRPAKPCDAERIAELCRQLGYPSSPKEAELRLTRSLADRGSAVWVAERRKGDVVGWVQVAIRPLVIADRHAEIEGLVVDVDHRCMGVGRLLVKEAELWARKKGCGVVSLRSNVVRKEARPFYEELGYSVIKTQWTFRKVLRPEKRRQKC